MCGCVSECVPHWVCNGECDQWCEQSHLNAELARAGDESSGRTPPPVAGSAPSHTAMPNKASSHREAGRRAPAREAGRPGPQGPWGVWRGLQDPPPPRPAPARSLETGTRHPRPRANAHLGTCDRGAEPAPRGSRDPGQRPRGGRPPTAGTEAGGRRERQIRAGRLPGGAAAPARLAPRWLPPPPPERPRLPRAGLAGGPADSEPLSPEPAPRSRPAPRPGHARWPPHRLGTREGAVPAGHKEPERGEAPLTCSPSSCPGLWPLGSWSPRPSRKGRRGCLSAARLPGVGRAVSDLSLESPAKALSFHRGGSCC